MPAVERRPKRKLTQGSASLRRKPIQLFLGEERLKTLTGFRIQPGRTRAEPDVHRSGTVAKTA